MMTLVPLFSLACQPEVSTTPDDTAAEQVVDCSTEITATWPLQDSTDAYWRTDIEFVLDEVDDTATVVADFAGTQSTRQDGKVIVFTPDEPLTPGESYSVALDYCRGTPELAFTVSDFGEPMDDTTDLMATAWSLDLASARFIDAEGLGDIVANFLQNALLLGVTEAGADSFTLAIAKTEGGEQDPCSRTTFFPTADFSESPYWELSGTDVVIAVNEVELHLSDMDVAGTFSSDGSAMAGVTFTVTGDARDAGDWLGVEADVICELAEGIGAPCEPCGDGEVYCGTVIASDLDATAVGEPIAIIEELDPSCVEEKK